MELPSLSEVGRKRKKLGLTQAELAKKAGVSQSIIARIEAGTVDPRYTKVVSVFRALEELRGKEVEARKIMTKNVVGVQTVMKVGDAIKKMSEYGVSQMPVYEGDTIVGSVSESVILDQIGRGVEGRVLSNTPVEEYMEDSFPQVNPDTPLSVVSALLEHNTAVLVSEKGAVKGVITKADVLKLVHE
ncbi:MAG: CBS domain-containing protein [Candidatus Altiarchaeota archaeon]